MASPTHPLQTLTQPPGDRHTATGNGPPLTYFRAGMVVGSESESYRTLRYLVERLPAMIASASLSIKTQPIGTDDELSCLSQAPDVEASAPAS